MIALLQAQKAGLLAPKNWLPNIIAGLIVGIVALPLAMAFAIASGVKPEQGIYTAIIAGLAVSVLGGSKVQIAGPTGAFIVILAGVVAQYGIEGLQIATLMAGVILLLLGLLRLGSVIRYIPDPVIIGFTAGIGVIIWVGQWRDFFGLPEVQGTHFHHKLWFLLSHLGQLNVATTALGVLALAILIVTPRVRVLARIPGPLIALIVVTVLQALFQFKGVSTIGSAFGEIPRGLPTFQLPELHLSKVLELIGPAFAIAMLGAIESLLSAVVADNMTGTRHDSNQELVGQGVANILTPMFGGIAATGAIARTATNIRNGGNSPIAGIVHCLVLVLILMVLAPLASYIPLTCLAAILFMVAWNMSQIHVLIQMQKRAPWIDLFILWVTFALTVLADLVVAVNIGVVLAMLYVLKRTADSVQVRLQSEREVKRVAEWPSATPLPANTAVYSIEGPIFFAAVEVFQQTMKALPEDARYIVLRLNYVPFLDVTALQVIEGVAQQLHAQGRQLVLSEANDKVRNKLKKMGVISLALERNVYPSLEEALHAVQHVQSMDITSGPA